MALCAPCNRRFGTQHALSQHLNSATHRCEHCYRFFESTSSKKQHAQSSCYYLIGVPAHGSNMRGIKLSNPGVPEMQTEIHEITTPYFGLPRSMVKPVFEMACRLRFMKIDVEMLLKYVDTKLDHEVVSYLVEAALRLVPPNKTLEDASEARMKMIQKAGRASFNEKNFVNQFRALGYEFLTEDEQKKLQIQPTPDIRFYEPVMLSRQWCYWVEYKSYFGFSENPHINSKDSKQFKKYATKLGPGAVVYKLGYEMEHITVQDVTFHRETEFLDYLRRQFECHD